MKNAILLFLLHGIICSLFAQELPVSKEPRHHPVFENKKIRILNVLLPAGDTTFYHLHSTPSVFISLSTTKTAAQIKGAAPTPFGLSTQGNIWFENLNPPHTRVHRVWNEDTSTFHVVDVELFTDNSPFKNHPLSLSHTQLIIDTSWVRVYKIELAKGDKTDVPQNGNSFLLMTLNNAGADIVHGKRRMTDKNKEGDFLWINEGDRISIANEKDKKAAFALLEIK